MAKNCERDDTTMERDDKRTDRGNSGSARNKRNRGRNAARQDTRKSSSSNYYSSPTNDWRWYVSNEQLLKDTASFSYAYATGTPMNLGVFGDDLNKNGVPGIMKLKYVPTVGWSDSDVSPVNVAARNMYSFIRQANSGGRNYDSPDLIMYLLAMDSAISYLAYCKRIYGVVMLASVINRYYPKAIVESMKIDFEDICNNLTGLRAFINIYAQKLSAMAIPANLSYNAKHMWMCSGLYMDSTSGKGQTYYFEPEGFHIYTRDPDGASYLKFEYQFDNMGHSGNARVEDIIRFGNKILDPILYGMGEEDFNIISGDIMKAYQNVYRAEGISEDYTVVPMMDEVVLSQIENATLYGYGVNSNQTLQFERYNPALEQKEAVNAPDMYSIYQSKDKSHIVAKPARMYQAARKPLNMTARDRVLNAHVADPTPAFSLEATRYTNIPVVYKNINNQFYGCQWRNSSSDEWQDGVVDVIEYVTAGSEILTRGFMYNYSWVNNVAYLNESDEVQSNVTITVPANVSNLGALETANWDQLLCTEKNASQLVEGILTQIDTIAELSNFDWHPQVTYTGVVTSRGGEVSMERVNSNGHQLMYSPDFINGDMNNYTIVNQSNLRQMSEVSLLSMLGIVGYGK